MNAADQRHLTPVLGTLVVLAVVLLAALMSGLGRGVHWQAAGKAALLPANEPSATVKNPPLQDFADTWRHPLFSPDRQPVAESGGANANVTLGDLELTGIILTPDLRMVLLHGRSGEDVRVREGASVGDSGWTLLALKAHSAVFSRNSQRTELRLKVAGEGRGDDKAPTGDAGATPAQRPVGRPPPPHTRHPERAAALNMRPPGRDAPTAVDRAGEREKQQRIKALHAHIEARRRALEAQKGKEH